MARVLATYRLQLHAGFGLAAARRVVPYLARLGVSHVYSSPLLRARPGSTHGYDVVDFTTVDPALGGESAFAALVGALRGRDMGIVLDIVPNHMAVSDRNPFWNDVLEHGRSSRYASWFDIDWEAGEGRTRGRVLLPVLGDWYESVLASGDLRLTYANGRFRVRYFDAGFPVDPRTIAVVLDEALAPRRGGDAGRPGRLPPAVRDELGSVAAALRALPPREPDKGSTARRRSTAAAALRRLQALVERSGAARARVEQAVRAFGGAEGAGRLRRLLDAQAYALVHWRRARGEVNYRRFFDINELVAVRVEDAAVFEATHARVLGWVADGRLDGLRVDHVDGLLDPRRYLERLRGGVEARLPAARREVFVLLVEKILGADERLPSSWPVAGTTGYEFLNQLEALFLDSRGAVEVEEGYRLVVGRSEDFAAAARRGKRSALTKLLATDVQRLALRLRRIARREPAAGSPALPDLAAAIVETIVHLPVYRTYLDGRPGSPRTADRTRLEGALAAARAGRRAPAPALDLLERVRLGASGVAVDPALERERLAFVLRFQQTSGPAAAKGVEDTALYVHVPLLSRNEVGGDPGRPVGDAPRAFQAANRQRARRWPRTLLCTTTHDTKRSADVRARLDVLTEVPELWLEKVARWRRWNAGHRRHAGPRLAPDANTEYLLYQTLVGVWPSPPEAGTAGKLPQGGERRELRERLETYMEKAAREAKVQTSWIDPDLAFEDALRGFIRAILPDEGSSPFLDDVPRFVAHIGRAGLWNALARTLVHLTAPGTPDLYQGDELWNFSLVDPDNRRPVDFALRARLLEELEAGFASATLARASRAGPTGGASAVRSAPALFDSDARDAFLRGLLETPEDGKIKLHVILRTLAARAEYPELFRDGTYLRARASGHRAAHLFTFVRVAGARAALAVVPRLTVALVGSSRKAPVGWDAWRGTALRLPAATKCLTWTNALSGVPVPVLGRDRRTVAVAEALRHLPVALLVGIPGRRSARTSSSGRRGQAG